MNVPGKVASKCLFIAVCLLAGWGCAGGAVEAANAKETEAAMKQISIAVTVPDAGWQLRIERVLDRGDEVWVLAQLWRKPGPAAQMIRQVKAEAPVAAPDKPVRVFVAGKTWSWANKEPYEFVASLNDVTQRARDARVLYAAPESGRGKEAK